MRLFPALPPHRLAAWCLALPCCGPAGKRAHTAGEGLPACLVVPGWLCRGLMVMVPVYQQALEWS
jgi:hypothetical protein